MFLILETYIAPRDFQCFQSLFLYSHILSLFQAHGTTVCGSNELQGMANSIRFGQPVNNAQSGRSAQFVICMAMTWRHNGLCATGRSVHSSVWTHWNTLSEVQGRPASRATRHYSVIISLPLGLASVWHSHVEYGALGICAWILAYLIVRKGVMSV